MKLLIIYIAIGFMLALLPKLVPFIEAEITARIKQVDGDTQSELIKAIHTSPVKNNFYYSPGPR